jgi:hypothetical protein
MKVHDKRRKETAHSDWPCLLIDGMMKLIW